MERDDVIATLNDLIATSKDGEGGFGSCADSAKNPTLKAFFQQKSERCREGAVQLQAVVRQMGGDPNEAAQPPARCTASGSVSAT